MQGVGGWKIYSNLFKFLQLISKMVNWMDGLQDVTYTF